MKHLIKSAVFLMIAAPQAWAMPLFKCDEARSVNDDGSVITYAQQSSATLEDDGTNFTVSLVTQSQNSPQALHIESRVTSVEFVSNPDAVDKAKGDFYTLDLGDGRSLVLSPVNDLGPWFEVVDQTKTAPLISSFSCVYEEATLEILRLRAKPRKPVGH